MKNTTVIVSIVSLFLANIVCAQDPGFSQYYATPLFVNTAFVGDKQDLNFGVNHRTFTNSQLAHYNLTQIAGIIPFEADFLYKKRSSSSQHSSGLGFSVYREATGRNDELNTFGSIISVAHCIQLEREHFLSMGIHGGYIRKMQGDNFNWGSQYSLDFGYDPSVISSVDDALNDFSHFPSFGFGIQYFYKSGVLEDYFKRFDFDAYTGIAFYNVNRPNQSFFDNKEARLPLVIKYNAGLKYHATKRYALYPTLLWEHQNLNNQVNLGMYANVRTSLTEEVAKDVVNILVGVWYRVGDSFITSVGCTYYDFKFAISYDFNATNFSYNNRGKGATEVSLKYTFASKTGRRQYSRGLLYPSF